MADIPVTNITTGEFGGEGIYDKFMESINATLDDQFNKQRINGATYAQVLLGTMQSAMDQSVRFALEQQRAARQAELLEAQIANTEQDTLHKVAQTTLTENEIIKTQTEVTNLTIQGQVLVAEAAIKEQQVLVAEQEVLNMIQEVRKSTAEVDLIEKQVEKIDADIVIAQQQLATMASEIALINARKELVDAQVLSEASQRLKIDAEIDLISAQESKITQEIALMVQRVANLAAEKLKTDAETALLAQRLLTEVQQTVLITNQAAKIAAEIDLIVEKKWVERAQYSDTTGSPSAAVAGVIGKQKELFTAQKDGFTRDAEQKAAKIMVDSFNVRKSADPNGTFTTANNLDDDNIAVVMEKLIEGIGGTVV